MLTDQAYHLIVSVTPLSRGSSRKLSYALSDVIKRTDSGNDPLSEWAGRNPGRHAIWLQWSPMMGISAGGETTGASELAVSALKGDRLGGEFERELLRGVEIALRVESGYYGEGESHINFAPRETTDGAQN